MYQRTPLPPKPNAGEMRDLLGFLAASADARRADVGAAVARGDAQGAADARRKAAAAAGYLGTARALVARSL